MMVEIKTTEEIEKISYDLFQSCQMAKNPKDTRMYSNEWKKHQDKKWVDKERLEEAMSLVNKKLFDDDFGSYDWNELLIDILENGVDE